METSMRSFYPFVMWKDWRKERKRQKKADLGEEEKKASIVASPAVCGVFHSSWNLYFIALSSAIWRISLHCSRFYVSFFVAFFWHCIKMARKEILHIFTGGSKEMGISSSAVKAWCYCVSSSWDGKRWAEDWDGGLTDCKMLWRILGGRVLNGSPLCAINFYGLFTRRQIMYIFIIPYFFATYFGFYSLITIIINIIFYYVVIIVVQGMNEGERIGFI